MPLLLSGNMKRCNLNRGVAPQNRPNHNGRNTMNSVRRDAENAVSTLEGEIDSLGNATIDDLSSYFRDVQSAFSTLESEVGYLSSEHEEFEDELDGWRELGNDAEDVAAELEELEALKEAAQFVERDKDVIEQAKGKLVELDNLKRCHENQRVVILGLLEQLSKVNALVTRDAVNKLLGDLAITPSVDSTPVEGTGKEMALRSDLPPNCS